MAQKSSREQNTEKRKLKLIPDTVLKEITKKKSMLAGAVVVLIIFSGTALIASFKKSPVSQITTITSEIPTGTPSATTTAVQPLPTQVVISANTPIPTPPLSPTPTAFRPGPFTFKNAEISSRFIEVSIGQGGETEAFTIKSKGAHEYKIDSLRIFGVSGLSLSPTQSVMANDETKQIKLLSKVDPFVKTVKRLILD